MKTIAPILFCCFAILFNPNVNADLIWSDNPSTRADGSVDGLATQGGSGLYDTFNSVAAVNGSGLVLTADGGTDWIEIESTAAALAGNFTFDMTSAGTGTGTDLFFLQLIDGDARSTGGSPLPNFSDTVNGTPTAGGTTTINYFFNASGVDIMYTAPDASTRTLVTGAYDYWRDTTLTTAGATQSNNGAGAPTLGVDTLVMTTFNNQNGAVFTFDNMSFNSIQAVPEPAMLLPLGLMGLVILRRRRK